MSFHDKLQRMAQIPEFADPNSASRQLFNTHMQQLFPNQRSWQEHLDQRPVVHPDNVKMNIAGLPLPAWLKEGVVGPLGLGLPSVMPWSTPTNIGFDWRKRANEADEEDQMMKRYGVTPRY
jgi:hypothetical protein